MADFAAPTLISSYSDFLDKLKERDNSAIQLLDGTTDINLPSGTKRWNSTNFYFEKFDGSAWSPMAAKYMINVNSIDGCLINNGGSTSNDLWTADKITTVLSTKLDTISYTAADVLAKVKSVDGAGSGLDADLLDGMNAASSNLANTVVYRDVSGNFSAGTITGNLNGNASTATASTTSAKLTTARTISISGDVSGSASFDGTANINIAVTSSGKFIAGMIMLWSGSAASIPSGWYLCNGSNGTPNLMDRFIVGAGSSYSVGAQGGSANSTLPAHTHTGSTTTAGAHTHSYSVTNWSSTATDWQIGVTMPTSESTANTGSSGEHTHSFTTSQEGSSPTNTNLPPYYALCYIMKS